MIIISIPPYQEALKKSGSDYTLTFDPTTERKRKNLARTRNVTYFNPPFSCKWKLPGGQFDL